MTQIIDEIYTGVVEGKNVLVQEKVQQALASGEHPAAILNRGMIAAMAEVGRLFEAGEYYVPEMLISARAMQAGMALLKPHLQQTNIEATGKVIIGTVSGDLHDIGKNLVAMMLEGAGFEIQDLGTNVGPDKFIAAVKTSGDPSSPVIVAMSALLTTTMTNMKTTIDALEQAGLRNHVRVIVGGAPLTESYAQQIGADGYGVDASRAVSVAKSLVNTIRS